MDTGLIWVYLMCCVLLQTIHGQRNERRRNNNNGDHSDCKRTECFPSDDEQQITCDMRKLFTDQCGSAEIYKCVNINNDGGTSEGDETQGRDEQYEVYETHKYQQEISKFKKRATDCKHKCDVCRVNALRGRVVICGKHKFICKCENKDDSRIEQTCPDSSSSENDPKATTEMTERHSNQNGQDNYTAMYVVVVLLINLVLVVLLTFLIWRRHKSQANTRQDDNNILVTESSTAAPTSGPPGISNDHEYSEIPVDAIYSDTTDNASNMSAVNNYDHLTKRPDLPRDDYSHLISTNKLEHTDNTYNHIAHTPGSQQEQKPYDESDDAYNKLHNMPTNEPGNTIKNLDPDYHHLKYNHEPDVGNKSIDTDDYSHIGQSQEQKGQYAATSVSTVQVHKEVCVDKTVLLSTGNFKDAGKSAATAPVFTLEQGNEDNGKNETERHYFILEKHDKETDDVTGSGVVPDYEVPVDHEYFVLEKQDDAMS